MSTQEPTAEGGSVDHGRAKDKNQRFAAISDLLQGPDLELWPKEAGTYGLSKHEVEWFKLQPFLETRGFMLRDRYKPGWEKTWPRPLKFGGPEDQWPALFNKAKIMDATRISDGQRVFLKRVPAKSSERRFTAKLGSGDLIRDPRNHCVPLLDVIELEGSEDCLLVLPLLRSYNHEPFESIGCCLDFVRQTLEALQFLHEHRIAHCDFGTLNILQSLATCPDGCHPQYQTFSTDLKSELHPLSRTEVGGVRYYIIDFELTVDLDAPETHENGKYGQIFPPEMTTHRNRRHDPAKVDVYVLGGVYKEVLLEEYSNMPRFMSDLVKYMQTADPAKRPSIAEVAARFEAASSGWYVRNVTSNLRARRRKEFFVASFVRDILHLPRQYSDLKKGKKHAVEVHDEPSSVASPSESPQQSHPSPSHPKEP